jgi:hypothetical protein
MITKLKTLFYFIVLIHILHHCESKPTQLPLNPPKYYYPDTLNRKSSKVYTVRYL